MGVNHVAAAGPSFQGKKATLEESNTEEAQLPI